METLEIFWVVSMLGLGLVFSWCAAIRDWENCIIAAVVSLTLSVVFAWNNALSLLYLEMQALLPDHGTELNEMTAFFLTSLMVLFFLSSILFSPFLFMDKDANVSRHNFLKAFRKTDGREV